MISIIKIQTILYRFFRTNKLLYKVLDNRLTYLSFDALKLLKKSVNDIEKNKIKGVFIETGCALGGSSIIIAREKNRKRKFKVFDSFEMMPEPSNNDENDIHERFQVIKEGKSKGIGDDLYYGYEKDLLSKVKENFILFNINPNKSNIAFIKGYYEDSLKINEAVAFAHIDCDWYDSVFISLIRIEPYLTIGGMIIIDDYYDFSGCKKATDDYFIDKMDRFLFHKKERLIIEKLK